MILQGQADPSFIPRPLDIKIEAEECLGYVGEQVPVVLRIRNDDDRKIYLRLSIFLPPSEDEQGAFHFISTYTRTDGTDITAKYEDQESTSLLQDINLGPLEPSSVLEKTVFITFLSPGSKLIDFSLQASLSDDDFQRVEEINHTLTLDVEDPFEISTQVMYRHASRASKDDVDGWATVMSLLTLPGGRGMTIESIDIEAKVSHR